MIYHDCIILIKFTFHCNYIIDIDFGWLMYKKKTKRGKFKIKTNL